MSEEYLMHWGVQRDHKYISRKMGAGGKWIYEYADSAKNTASSAVNTVRSAPSNVRRAVTRAGSAVKTEARNIKTDVSNRAIKEKLTHQPYRTDVRNGKGTVHNYDKLNRTKLSGSGNMYVSHPVTGADIEKAQRGEGGIKTVKKSTNSKLFKAARKVSKIPTNISNARASEKFGKKAAAVNAQYEAHKKNIRDYQTNVKVTRSSDPRNDYNVNNPNRKAASAYPVRKKRRK